MAETKDKPKVIDYEKLRYKVKCTKCGNVQFDGVSGHICVKCSGVAEKI